MNNGELLRAAESAAYEDLLRIDQGIPHQQNFAGRKLSLILLQSPSNRIEDLLPLKNRIFAALITIAPGETVSISVSS